MPKTITVTPFSPCRGTRQNLAVGGISKTLVSGKALAAGNSATVPAASALPLTVAVVLLTCILNGLLSSAALQAQDRSLKGNPELSQYFEAEVTRLEQQNDLTRFKSLEEWQTAQPQLREQLFDMLGLSPRPEKSSLEPEITGTTEHPEFLVERVHFQSMPGLYVTGNFYRPRTVEGPLPTILYVCGHGQVKKDGVSFGNKTHYQHHGGWFARNGYCCLTIDTLQLGEIEGIHHGTHRENRWWWNSRGYTPAGVEAWNCIRALDYLESRPEVDTKRLGVTGRSGGGAYSWWIAALDERIQCAVPVAGITSLRDHVVNGCVEGHCDCMFMVNTFRWDYATVAALVAPRTLLISNTDKDSIFPLEGVVDIHRQVRHIYDLHGAGKNLGLQITEGPHEDTQELHIHAFRWFNRFFRNDKSMVETTAVKFFDPAQLKVFATLPTDEVNTRIDEIFVPQAESSADAGNLAQRLKERSFRAWPDTDSRWSADPDVRTEPLDIGPLVEGNSDDLRGFRVHLESQPHVSLSFDVVHQDGASLEDIRSVELLVTDSEDHSVPATLRSRIAADTLVIVFNPRGTGIHGWSGDPKKQTQILRRFQLTGTTADAMRIWDIRRVVQTARRHCPGATIQVSGATTSMNQLGAIATLFESGLRFTGDEKLFADPMTWPSILNLSRTATAAELEAAIVR
jgi:dienelactone hydrolase